MNYKIDNLQYCNWSRKIFEINRSAGLDAVHVTIVHHEDFDELQLEIKKWEKLFLENSDLICLDGLENIIANEEWETAVFNLINNTLNNKCRLVFSSSIEGSNNIFSLPDLDSRIKKLQSYELYPVDDANLENALKHIANLSSINLGEREAKYLLTYSKRNMSDLVSILESLDQLSMEKKKRISIPLIKEII